MEITPIKNEIQGRQVDMVVIGVKYQIPERDRGLENDIGGIGETETIVTPDKHVQIRSPHRLEIQRVAEHRDADGHQCFRTFHGETHVEIVVTV